jgi:serine/threonine protein kinase
LAIEGAFKLNVEKCEGIYSNAIPEIITKYGLGKSTTIKLSDGQEIPVNFDELEEKKILGKSQFTVFLMLHKPSDKYFAVKVSFFICNKRILSKNTINITNQKSIPENEIDSRFTDLEASIKIGNNSPYLNQYYGALYARCSVWLIQEPMDTSLDKFLAKKKELNLNIKESFIAKIAFCVLRALIHLKRLKLIHRDVKPANILLNKNGEAKLCDYGIVGFTSNSSFCESYKGHSIYMAVSH